MSRWIWILLALSISTGAYFTIRYGLRPKPIPVMNASAFANVYEIGVVTYKRLRQNVRAERVLVLGSNPEVRDAAEVWSGFLDAALADGAKLTVFTKEGIAPLNPKGKIQAIPFTQADQDSGALTDRVLARLKASQLVVVHAGTLDVTHLMPNSISHRLDKAVQHPVMSLSTMNLPLAQAQGDDLQAHCLDATPDASGAERLACAAFRAARKVKKKKLDQARIWAASERHGLKEFLVFIHQPSQ